MNGKDRMGTRKDKKVGIGYGGEEAGRERRVWRGGRAATGIVKCFSVKLPWRRG